MTDTQRPPSEPEAPEVVADALKACAALYLAVDSSIASDVQKRVRALAAALGAERKARRKDREAVDAGLRRIVDTPKKWPESLELVERIARGLLARGRS